MKLDVLPTEVIGGLPVAALGRNETADLMIELVRSRRGTGQPPAILSSVNGQVISEIARSPEMASALASSHLLSADGQSVVFASRLLGTSRVTERVATTDLFHDVAARAVKLGVSFYLLGASEHENARAAANLKLLYPDLTIAGRRHGYFRNEAEEIGEVQKIASLKPDILWVCMGFPREQMFGAKWGPALAGVPVIKTAGGLLNYLSGTRSRAPMWMQAAGFEWAYRLLLEPRRLFWRYFVTNLHATVLLLTKSGPHSKPYMTLPPLLPNPSDRCRP